MARPVGVTILGVLLILAAIVLFLIGLSGIFVGLAGLIPSVEVPVGATILWGLFYIVIAILMGAAGGGLLGLRPWAWWLAIISVLASIAWILYDTYLASTGTGVLTAWGIFLLFVAGILFVYLLAVRRWFGAPAPAA